MASTDLDPQGLAARVEELTGLLAAGRRRAAERRIASWGGDDAVFGHLDARGLLTTDSATHR